MATIHAFLRQDQDDEPDTVFYGPSTGNKVPADVICFEAVQKFTEVKSIMHAHIRYAFY